MLSDGTEVLQSMASLPFPAHSRIPVSTMPRILFTMQEKSISSSSHGTTCFSRVIRREAKFMCSVRASSSTTALFTSSSPPMSLVPVSAPAPTVTSRAPLLLEASDDRPLEPSVQGPEGETLPQLSGGPGPNPWGASWPSSSQVVYPSLQAPASPNSPLRKEPTRNYTRVDWDPTSNFSSSFTRFRKFRSERRFFFLGHHGSSVLHGQIRGVTSARNNVPGELRLEPFHLPNVSAI